MRGVEILTGGLMRALSGWPTSKKKPLEIVIMSSEISFYSKKDLTLSVLFVFACSLSLLTWGFLVLILHLRLEGESMCSVYDPNRTLLS